MSEPLENSDFITTTPVQKAEKAESVKPEDAKKVVAAKSDESFLLYVNGKKKQIAVKNPEFDKGRLTYIEDLQPFFARNEGDKPTVEDAQTLKRGLYNDFFKKPFKNLLVLSGAGSSVDVGLPLMTGLWKFVKDELGEKVFDKICSTIKHTAEWDFELLISRLEGYIQYNDDTEIEGKKLSSYREDILKVIRHHTNIGEPSGKFPHVTFLQKLLQRKQTSSRVKVFTLNYDLLFEKAANKINAVIIDGFSFTSPRTFSGRYFDYDIVQREGSKVNEEDNFVTRVFHLYKLHGSLNWQKETDTSEIIINDKAVDPLMVYPREGKYKDSYGQPFFEMIARFQRNLRQDNDTLLICIGYSFNDNHINAAIEEAINQNPGFRIAVVDPFFCRTSSKAFKRLIAEAFESDKIMIVSETFTDFADYFPEIQTYDNELRYTPINLRNDGQ
ncbi:SIR2 family protein [Sphingobacterium detergens]|uniref:SIR2 family protein n=1 Tax=Sphingobacterium detergens TaxID=1145106 RepID=UPI003AAF4704